MYFTLISFNMMGYVIYQYHEALGVPLRKAAPRARDRLSPIACDVLRRLETLEPHLQELVLDGRTQDASDMLYELMRKRSGECRAARTAAPAGSLQRQRQAAGPAREVSTSNCC